MTKCYDEERPSRDDLVNAIRRAVDAKNLLLVKGFDSVSQHAYHAGMRDAYLKVLATVGERYEPDSWIEPTDADGTPWSGHASRLATIRPTGPNLNVFNRRTTITDDPAEPVRCRKCGDPADVAGSDGYGLCGHHTPEPVNVAAEMATILEELQA